MSDVLKPGPGLVAEVRELFDGTVREFIHGRGIHGYAESARCREGNVCIAWGGNGGTVFVDLPGDACARVRDWTMVRWWLETNHGWQTRVDLAYDDFEGVHNIDEAVERYRSGEFIAGGRPPRIKCIGNWIDEGGDQYGRTLEIGKRGNGKQLVVYEKGRQLRPDLVPSDPWVRWECRFGNKDRVLPLDMVTRPREYFARAYPALEFVDGSEGGRIRVRKAQERLSVGDLTRHGQSAYGGLVAFLMAQGGIDKHGVRYALSADQVIERFKRDAVPRRLSTPTAYELAERANAQLAEASCSAL